MKQDEKKKVKAHATNSANQAIYNNLVIPPQSQNDKYTNYNVIKGILDSLRITSVENMVKEAAGLIGKAKIPPVAILVERPPQFDARAALKLIQDSSALEEVIGNVSVRIDNDQLPHQPPEHPIGTRRAYRKYTFDSDHSSEDWHQGTTMARMATWANSLQLSDLAHGKKAEHGQSQSYDGISYEGFCQFIEGTRYVLFHCYPATDTKEGLAIARLNKRG